MSRIEAPRLAACGPDRATAKKKRLPGVLAPRSPNLLDSASGISRRVVARSVVTYHSPMAAGNGQRLPKDAPEKRTRAYLSPARSVPASVKHWTLTTLREKLIKIGAKVCTMPGT